MARPQRALHRRNHEGKRIRSMRDWLTALLSAKALTLDAPPAGSISYLERNIPNLPR